MINLGMTTEGRRALVRTLSTPGHRVSSEVTILDLDHRPLGRVGRVISGQVNIDANASITRQAQLEILDPAGSLNVDSTDGRPRLDRMVRVHYLVYVEAPVWDWVAIPIFTGPITQVSREDHVVSIEASGKEYLAQGPTWKPRTFAKGLNRVNVIRVIMKELAGETRFSLPHSWPARLAEPISMGKQSSAWTYARHVAKSMNAQLFYDGRGQLRLRKVPVRPAYTFRDGPGGTLVTRPKVTESSEDLINAVRVIGAVPKGKKEPAEHVAFLPRSHMYSPHSLSRGGKVKYHPEEISDDTLRSKKEVQAAAERRIKEILVDEQTAEFNALPMPLLEEKDPYVIDSQGVNLTARISKMSISLGHEEVSTVGSLTNLKQRKRLINRKRR